MLDMEFSFNTSGVKSFCPLRVTAKITKNGAEVLKAEWMGRDVLHKVSQNERAWIDYQADQELRDMKKKETQL